MESTILIYWLGFFCGVMSLAAVIALVQKYKESITKGNKNGII